MENVLLRRRVRVAAILARMLGIHIKVAVARQEASAGDWMTYAADVAHRGTTPEL